MTLRTLLALWTVTLVPAAFAFGGCGSDEETPPATSAEAGTDDATAADGGDTPNPACKALGEACGSSVECCTASCTGGKCSAPLGTCKAPNEACSFGTECCTVSCRGGKCSDRLCTSDGRTCSSNEECCGGSCVGSGDGGQKTCKPLNGSCKTSGNKCAANSECCSKVCNGGVCAGQVSFCTQTGDACRSDFECCGGKCNKGAAASLGVCEVVTATGTPNCLVAGQVCSGGATGSLDAGVPPCGGECCSRACGPYLKTGVLVCEPPSGCRPTGETCRDSKDCCGFGGVKGTTGTGECSKAPGAALGRCDNGNACRPNGAICKLATTSCNAENNCCAGNVNQDPTVCQQDLLGIPRCTTAGNCGDAGAQQGKACATSADCCGLTCVPNPVAGGAPFVCGGLCVSTGGRCTSTADCCPGIPCVAAPGSTAGVCGGTLQGDGGVTGSSPDASTTAPDAAPPPPPGGCAYSGQACTTSADCCSGLGCSGGRCQVYVK